MYGKPDPGDWAIWDSVEWQLDSFEQGESLGLSNATLKRYFEHYENASGSANHVIDCYSGSKARRC